VLEAHAPRSFRDTEYAADAAEPSVERQLADGGVPVAASIARAIGRS